MKYENEVLPLSMPNIATYNIFPLAQGAQKFPTIEISMTDKVNFEICFEKDGKLSF